MLCVAGPGPLDDIASLLLVDLLGTPHWRPLRLGLLHRGPDDDQNLGLVGAA